MHGQQNIKISHKGFIDTESVNISDPDRFDFNAFT